MTPEKNGESIVRLPPGVKKAIAGGIVAASFVTDCQAAVGALSPERLIITLPSIPTQDPEKKVDLIQANFESVTGLEKPSNNIVIDPIGWKVEENKNQLVKNPLCKICGGRG